MDTNKYTVPSAETGVTTLLEKVFQDGLNQSELAAAYDDVSKDYDKVISRAYTVGDFCLLSSCNICYGDVTQTYSCHTDTYFYHFHFVTVILYLSFTN